MIENKRLQREKKTVGIMIKMYCNNHHKQNNNICENCNKLLLHALDKIDKCVFHQFKTVCSRCKVHCYKKVMRDKIKEVMRFSGSRLLIYHPMLGIKHLMDKYRY